MSFDDALADWLEQADDDDELPQELADAWPNCEIPDCHWKRCTWSGTVYCAPCAQRFLGRAEYERRFRATHPGDFDPLP